MPCPHGGKSCVCLTVSKCVRSVKERREYAVKEHVCGACWRERTRLDAVMPAVLSPASRCSRV